MAVVLYQVKIKGVRRAFYERVYTLQRIAHALCVFNVRKKRFS
jgi:hypothetical protein